MRRNAVISLACALACAGLATAAPPADVAADPQLRARRDTYHPVIDLLRAKAVRLSDEQMEKLKGFPLEAVWASVLCISGTYGQLLDYVIFAALVFYFLTTIALFRLRRLRPDLPRPVKAFGYPVLPGLYLLSVGALMVILLFEKPLYTWPGLLIVATGIPVYLIWRGRQTA